MVFYDNHGRPTAYTEDDIHIFTENATGSGPIKPVKHVCPVKCVKRVKPVKHIKRVRRIKAVKKLNWSQLSGVVFFAQ